MDQYELTTPPRRRWSSWLILLFLLACLVIGLAVANYTAPEPVIGVVRFADVIWTDTVDNLVYVLETAGQDDQIAAVVLEIDSPGGLTTSSEKAFYSLLRLRERKPLIVVVDGIAASGGYYMAAAANRIYAAPSSYVGNVGVRGPRPLDPVLYPDELSTGPYKLSGGDRFDQIRQLDLLKAAFVNNVVQQRSQAELNPLTIDAETVAEARLYVGLEAIAIGLVDAEGSLSDAISAAADLAGVTSYRSQDLIDFYDLPFSLEFQQPMLAFREAIAQRLATVGPNTSFALDTRIPLTPAVDRTILEAHLLQLRATAPGPLRFSPSQLPAESE
jgi:protease-4